MLALVATIALGFSGDPNVYTTLGWSFAGPNGVTDSPPAVGGFAMGAGVALALETHHLAFVPHAEFEHALKSRDSVVSFSGLFGITFEHVRAGVGPVLHVARERYLTSHPRRFAGGLRLLDRRHNRRPRPA